MSMHNQRNNRKPVDKNRSRTSDARRDLPAKAGKHSEKSSENRQLPRKGGAYFLYGRHPVEAALANPKRKMKRLLATKNAASTLPPLPADLRAQVVTSEEIAALLPEGAVHQGIALEVQPLGDGNLDDIAWRERPIIILDQVTDPHNIGAILRSAAAFDAGGVIVMKHNAPDETGVLAKSASGALEVVPYVRVPNLVQTMEYLKKKGYWCAGLDGAATQTLAEAKLTPKTVLVMGAEGAGLRRLTAENCDLLVKLPISDKMESLNVSNAAAIALYELNR